VNTIFQARTGLALTVIDSADQSLQLQHHGSINIQTHFQRRELSSWW